MSNNISTEMMSNTTTDTTTITDTTTNTTYDTSELEEKEENIDSFNIYTNFKLPIVYELPKRTISIPGHTNQVISQNIDYPLFSFGFQHYLHADKQDFKKEVIKPFQDKKKVYTVVNKYNKYIDNYDTDIESMAKVFFDTDPKPHMLNDDFYKYWELFCMFDIIPTSESGFISHHYGEGIGASAQAVIMYRDKFAKSTKKDSYKLMTSTNMGEYVDSIDKKFIDYYKREKHIRLSIDGEPNSHDLATVTCGTNWEYENLVEQDSFSFLVNQIDQAINTQNKGGTLICKVDETYTITMNKLIYLLTGYYEQVFMVKPLASDDSKPEKFIVCLNFIGKPKSLSKFIVNKGFLVNIFPDLVLPIDFVITMASSNKDISNRQFINMNKCTDFVKKNNYYGNLYQHYRTDQINASKYWIKTFMVDDIDKKQIERDIKKYSEQNKIKTDNLIGRLV